MLEAGDRRHQPRLDVARQRRRDPVGIDRVVLQPLGLEKDVVARAVGEPHHLVLDRGAVARAGALDAPAIERRAVEIGADHRVDGRGGVGDVARTLRRRDLLGEGGEGRRRIVAVLDLEPAPVDGAAVEARRRPRLEPAERERSGQAVREADGGRLPDPARRPRLLADMDAAAQERAGGQDHRARRQLGAVVEADAGDPADPADPAPREEEVLDRALAHGEARGGADLRLHGRPVEGAVGLGPRAAHGRPLAAVEDAELDPGAVGDPRHQAVEGVDLAHQVALAEAADGRVARHLADRRGAVRDQERPRAHARRGRGGLAAGMAATDDDDVGAMRRFPGCRTQGGGNGRCHRPFQDSPLRRHGLPAVVTATPPSSPPLPQPSPPRKRGSRACRSVFQAARFGILAPLISVTSCECERRVFHVKHPLFADAEVSEHNI